VRSTARQPLGGGTGLPLSLTSPKKNTKKAQAPPNPKTGANASPELHQIAVNCGKYNQIAVVNFLFLEDILATKERKTRSKSRNCTNTTLQWIMRTIRIGPTLFLATLAAFFVVMRSANGQAAIPAPSSQQTAAHPLDPLTPQEIAVLKNCLAQDAGLQGGIYVWAQLLEPPKDEVLAFRPGMQFSRQAEVVAISPSAKTSYEITVDLNTTNIESVKDLKNLQPFVANPEFDLAREIVQNSAAVRAALIKRGYQLTSTNISDRFFLDVYAPGRDSRLTGGGKTIRAIRVLFADRQGGANSYGPYVEGLMALVDVYGRKLIALDDFPGAVAKRSIPEDVFDQNTLGPKSDRKTRTSSPAVPNLKLNGNQVQWENWDFRFGFNQREGLTLHQIAFDDHGKLRSICYRASISEMLVPYSDPSPGWLWREFFDSGEYGLGYVSSEANAGKDLPADAITLDVFMPNESLEATKFPNRIFFYERDGGALFDHTQSDDGSRIYARANELVVGFVATVGNYDYVYKWVFREDGSFSFEAELNGLILNKTVEETNCAICAPQSAQGPGVYLAAGSEQFGTLVSPQVIGVFHQHWINLRLDFDIDGTSNAVEELETVPMPPDPKSNARERAFGVRRTVFGKEQQAMRTCYPEYDRAWEVYNPTVKSPLGHFPGYRIQPVGNTTAAISENRFGEDVSFIQRHFWTTKFHPQELYAAGKYPNQAPENYSDTLFEYTRNNESIYDQDVVVWYSLGFTHITEPEDFPIMPAAQAMVRFVPSGFFDKSPALGYAHIERPSK
jgi:primary-amine oxidase